MSDAIPPALTPDEWARVEPSDIYGHDDGGVYVGAYRGGDIEVGVRDHALIALANAALPDTDPRKITREWVREIRGAARDYALPDGFLHSGEVLNRIADALASYLPPETP